ncbi:MAG TPA: DMT family transporter, partial [Clostridiaceae bacterium]|nr:DMT family transporter [Clostridiaceae bacterium]
MERKLKKGHLLALITILIWSYASISSKILLDSFGPVELFFYRMLIAYIALLVIKPGFIKFRNIKEEFVFMAAGLTGVTMFFILQNVALMYSLASNVGVLLTIAPFFTA